MVGRGRIQGSSGASVTGGGKLPLALGDEGINMHYAGWCDAKHHPVIQDNNGRTLCFANCLL